MPYSQFGEDVLLHRIFRKSAGVCVEVGAHDGITFSNSLFFEQLGWRLCPSGAASSVLDPQLLRCMRNAARCEALERFSYDVQARSLGYLVDRVVKTPRRLNATLSMAQWQMPVALRPAWWYGFPEPIKRSARFLRERFRPFDHRR